MQQVVQPERGHTQRTIRLVAAIYVHWGAPEVIPYQVRPRASRPEVFVLLYSREIVETELVAERVEEHGRP